MCVAAIAWAAHPRYQLVAIGNRDEFHDRPAASLSRWEDGSGIIAGRDLRAGGTWLGVAENGCFALLTNFRDPQGYRPERLSRGGIVTRLLAGEELPDFAAMNPFNVVEVRPGAARFLTNFPEASSRPLAPGIHGISNGPFERPWPKTRQLCDALAGWLADDPAEPSGLFAALRAETPAPAGPLPADGPQPAYAPVFIRHPVYGTRCSSVVVIDQTGRGSITERSFDRQGGQVGETTIGFDWPGGA